jgi:hypothetical protein
MALAAATLGCSSRKEFCARFRSVNPTTQCDIDRLNKWVQGRSLPRASSVYTDFATVIGSSQSGRWVADCSLEEFATELTARTGVDAATLATPDSLSPRGNPRATGLFGGMAMLAGTFAAYSPAWSPHFRGRLLRGALRLVAGRNGNLIATYTESLIGRDVRLTAEAMIRGREPDGDLPLFISVQMPGPPASAMCGVISGSAFVAHDSLPSACRIIFVRVPETPRLASTNRYFDPIPGAIAAHLAELGANIAESDRFDAFTRGFLGTCPEQVTTEDQATFAGILASTAETARMPLPATHHSSAVLQLEGCSPC